MKRAFFLLATLYLVFSCAKETDSNGNGLGKDKFIHVTGISLDKAKETIKEGESLNLVATIIPENATNKSVNWISSDDNVASVERGIVIGIMTGNATIIATSEDGGKIAMCSITVERNLVPSVTIGVEQITAISAVLKGKANLGSTVSTDLKVGFQFSQSAGILPANSTTIEATEADADFNYTADVTGLDPSTTYYYRSFIRQNGQDTYGDTKEFRTKELSSLLHTQEASSLSAVNACLNARLDLTDVKYHSKTVGFYWGATAEAVNNKVTAQEGEGSAAANLSRLTPSKEYFFQAYIVMDGKELKEEVLSFTTKDIESVLGTLDATGIGATCANLSAKLDLTGVQYTSKSYGFCWGTSESNQNARLNGGEIIDNVYSASLISLSHKTQYWYTAYVTIDGQTFFGDVKTFTTDVVPVQSVSLDKTEYTFNTIGSTLMLNATVLPSDATDKTITWSSDKEDVATVNSDGMVTARGNGTAMITVKTKDQGMTATSSITVAQWVTGITLNNTSLTLNEGQEQILTATVNPTYACDQKLTWTSSDNSIVTVDNTGKVTARSKGTATIKVTANDGSGKYATCSVTVKRLVSSIVLDKLSIVVYNGKDETVSATVNPSSANNTNVTWSSSNNSVATVSNSGVVTGISRGTATITVTANDGSGVSATCEVEVKQYVTSIILDKTSLSLVEGGEEMLSVTSVLPDNANDKSYTWTSSDNSIVTVDNTGKVTARSKGTATIKVTANDGSGKYATCSVTVKRLVSSIVLDKLSIVVYNGKDETVSATVNPSSANNTNVTWSSSNNSVATVSNSGVVTGISRGTATITVTANDGSGVSATCEVEVKQYVTSIILDKTSLSLVEGGEEMLSVTSVLPDNANDKSYTWTSSDNSIVTVDNTGKVTARSKGTATIKVTANDGSDVSVSVNIIISHPCPAEAVDLGLTTSEGYNLYWATRSLWAGGFTKGYGEYYAWGETDYKNDYSWSSYKWCNGSEHSLTKYNTKSSYGTVDKKIILEENDDIAHVKLGSCWRIPTKEEWALLINSCTTQWTTQNGVPGRLLTSKKNGVSIFLPAGGRMDGSSCKEKGSVGFYWSSSLSSAYPSYAESVFCGESGFSTVLFERFIGLCIRPVYD